jgi:hypothetical protein
MVCDGADTMSFTVPVELSDQPIELRCHVDGGLILAQSTSVTALQLENLTRQPIQQ